MKKDESPQRFLQLRPFAISHSFITLKGDGGTSAIFSTLHGSLWLGKDKGSIMKSTESGGTIYYRHYYGNKLFE